LQSKRHGYRKLNLRCAPPALTHAAETTLPLTAWLLHNDVRVTHATATLHMVISMQMINMQAESLKFWAKSNSFLRFQSAFFQQLFSLV